MTLLRSKALWLGLVAMALAWAGSWELRQIYVEPSAAALTCNATPHPDWCTIRFTLLVGQHSSLFGVAALVAGAVALFRGGRAPAAVAAVFAAIAIANYNVEMGALALVLGLVALVRRRAKALPREDGPRTGAPKA
ncbi:MAG TPA: hypothetical protein VMF53_08505 [Alphaproteobacteria bacterium]|nr:hypothetical protein [Alphaproteobacteria bacterium]